jgi:hypothetical protein
MFAGTAPPQPPFIILSFNEGIGSPHPPRIERRLDFLRLVLFLLRLCLLVVENKAKPLEKNCFKLLIIYINNKIIKLHTWLIKVQSQYCYPLMQVEVGHLY